jgi:hypothetical protein
MDEERERGQGQTLPPHTALQLVLSYCVHHCYAGTVRVRSPIPRPPSELSHRHTLARLALPCMRPSPVACCSLAPSSRSTRFPPSHRR